jgi:hypothetical protein
MKRATRASGAIAVVCLLAATACSSDDDDTTSASAPATAVEDASDEPTTTEPPETTPSTDAPTTDAPATTEPEADEPAVTASSDEVQLLDFEFQAVPAGQYRVETLGAPFLIDIPEGWWVQPNSFGRFVITDADSAGPGDRDIVMIRPSNLADPDQPAAPVEEQAGDWPLGDINGWLEALIPGVVDGGPVDTTIGGLDAVQFDVAVTDEVACGEDGCVGFATNRLVNGMWFDPPTGYRVWWIDGGDESPIAINIGDGSDPEFTERAQAVLDTVTFESVGPNPIPSEGNLWELGIPSEVPAGTVTLPVGPGVTFEMSEPRFVVQDEFKANVLVDGPGEADIFFPDQAFDGEPLATVDDVVGSLERDPDVTATIVGTREVSGYEATEVDISSSVEPGPVRPPPTLQRSAPSDSEWLAPPDGTMWIMETPNGLAVITAEWFEPTGMEPAQALAAQILDSIVIGS